MTKLTKTDMARVIVQNDNELKNLPAADHKSVKHLVKKHKADQLSLMYERAHAALTEAAKKKPAHEVAEEVATAADKEGAKTKLGTLRKQFEKKLGKGKNKYIACYQKNPKFMVPDEIPENDHAHVLDLRADNLNQVFEYMQGENWSPNGEARELIVALKLAHTSMSVGDMIIDITNIKKPRYFAVNSIGFIELQFNKDSKTYTRLITGEVTKGKKKGKKAASKSKPAKPTKPTKPTKATKATKKPSKAAKKSTVAYRRIDATLEIIKAGKHTDIKKITAAADTLYAKKSGKKSNAAQALTCAKLVVNIIESAKKHKLF